MADQIKFTNNASSLLAVDMDTITTSLTVSSGQGALFPSPTGGEYFKVALVDDGGNLEICHCTARVGDLLTVARGQESTLPQTWSQTTTRVELRLTAGTMEEFLQKNGGVMTGDLDMDTNNLVDAVMTGGNTQILNGEIVGVPLRGAVGDSSNEILVPSDGSPATMGGDDILTANADLLSYFPLNTVILWYGSAGSVPAGWKICNGTDGTPDFRNRFLVGAGDLYTQGSTGGNLKPAGQTNAAGSHKHNVAVSGHALTVDEIPDHAHRVESDSVFGSYPDALKVVDGADDWKGWATDIESKPALLTEGNADAHTHPATEDTEPNHRHQLDNVTVTPPYIALYYIIRMD